MDYFKQLESRANAKGIYTFGDILKAWYGKVTKGDAYDVFGTEESEEYLNDTLFWCDAATAALEDLAQENMI